MKAVQVGPIVAILVTEEEARRIQKVSLGLTGGHIEEAVRIAAGPQVDPHHYGNTMLDLDYALRTVVRG